MRKTIRTVVMVLVAMFALSGISEAAPKRVVRHHVRHTTRVVRHRATVVRKAVRKKVRRVAHAANRTTRRVVKKVTTKPR